MQITYELTQKDFYEALIAHRNRNRFTKWVYRLLVPIVFLQVGYCLVQVVLEPDWETVMPLFPLLGVAAFWAILIWFCPWWAARNQFSKQPAAQGQKTMLLDDAGVHSKWSGGNSNVEWRTYIRWVESKGQFLIYPSPACFAIVPKRELTPEQIAEFRAQLAEHIPSKR